MEPTILCTELYVRLGDEDVLVLDCRKAEDWARFGLHIPGALWMTPEEIARDLGVLPDDELIVVCGCDVDGADMRRICRLLRRRGRDAVCLQGGLHAWVTGGLPTERHAPPKAAARH
ncbi:rhodanese-like domain-containing protein [Myxococcaceae bacterium GXIMD 01537]